MAFVLAAKLFFFLLSSNQKSNRDRTRRITLKCVTGGGAHLRRLAHGLHSSEEA